MKKFCIFLLLTAGYLLTACSSDPAAELFSPETETEATLETEAVPAESEQNPYDSDELNEILDKRENLTTTEDVRAWRAELNAYWDKGKAENSDETEPSAPEPIPSDPVTFRAEYYRGTFNPHHEGDFNDNITIELEFSAEVDRTVWRPGETVVVGADVKNIGSPFMYLPAYNSPDVCLEHEAYTNGRSAMRGYAVYTVYGDEQPIPEGIPTEELCETGDGWGHTVKITIPDNAFPGLYDIVIYSHGCTAVIKDAIEILTK